MPYPALLRKPTEGKFPLNLMILVAIFSIIVLLMCWLCYSGDYKN